MQRQQIGRMAGIILALLVAAGAIAWSQGGDTPIVILDGSLRMESAIPWNQFTGTGDQKAHPHTGKSVTKVAIIMPGKSQTIIFNSQQCTVDVTYGATDIKFTTGNNGTGLSVSPFGAFQNRDTPNRLWHKNQNVKISHVTVTKAGVTAFDSDASGGTTVIISYE